MASAFTTTQSSSPYRLMAFTSPLPFTSRITSTSPSLRSQPPVLHHQTNSRGLGTTRPNKGLTVAAVGFVPPGIDPDALYILKLWALAAGTVYGAKILASIEVPLILLLPWLCSGITLVPASDRPPIDITKLTTRYIGNTALIAPKDYVSPTLNLPPQAEAPKFFVPATELRDAFFRGLEKEPRFAFMGAKEGPDGKLTVGLVQRSLIFQFPDEVTVDFIPLEKGKASTMAIFSQSIYGSGDLGVNSARVKSLVTNTIAAVQNKGSP